VEKGFPTKIYPQKDPSYTTTRYPKKGENKGCAGEGVEED